MCAHPRSSLLQPESQACGTSSGAFRIYGEDKAGATVVAEPPLPVQGGGLRMVSGDRGGEENLGQ